MPTSPLCPGGTAASLLAMTRRVGLLGAGAIGAAVLDALEAGRAPGHVLAAILARPHQVDALRRVVGDRATVTAEPEAFLSASVDVVVEAAGHAAAIALGPRVAASGRDLLLVSVGALADPGFRGELAAAAAHGGARILAPSGGFAGFDGLRAMAQMGLTEVTYVSTKPPRSWDGTPGEAEIRRRAPDEAAILFDGAAADAARLFPKNANLAAAVALAGLGFERTRVKLVSNPAVHEIVGSLTARTEATLLEVTTRSRPTAVNPKSSQLVSGSVLAALANADAAIAFG
ncbi:MAG: aspartate dehydrogenase [Proteobacteria bacterium]|nr:aspartate dehydrogenase [Pseudomonadota bacterium]